MKQIILAVIAIALLIIVYFYFMQRHYIYYPDRADTNPATWGVSQMKLIQLKTADGLTLNAWYHPAAKSQMDTILYFHGNAGHIARSEPAMRPYMQAGYGVLLLEYRGYGNNPGSPSEQGLYRDARAAMHFLMDQGIATQKIVLYGESLGTGVAVQMASEFRVAAVVLQSPYTSMVSVGRIHYPYLPVWLLLKDRYQSIDKITTIHAPLFIIHGARDKVIPLSLGKQLYAKAQQPKQMKIYPLAGHNNLPLADMSSQVIQFLQQVD